MNFSRFLHSPLRSLAGATLLMAALLGSKTPAAHASATVTVLDSGISSTTSPATNTSTSSTPNHFMGLPFTLSNAGGTSNIVINGGTLYWTNTSGTNFNAAQATIYFWGSVNTGAVNSATPAFSNLIGTRTLTYSTVNTGFRYSADFTLATPITVPSQTVGITVGWAGRTGTTGSFVATNNLTNNLRYGPALPVGSALFNGYYRNANNESDGNFTSTLRSLSQTPTPTNQAIAINLTALVTEPTVTTTAATTVGINTATLNGTVNPRGVVTTAKFQYGLTTAYGSEGTVTLSPNNGTSAQSVNLALSGLTSNTTYHYRISATNAGGTSTGSDLTFTTAAVTPTITSFTPTSGTVGTPVVITGNDFIGSTVSFNGTPATSYTVDSATQITAIVPAGATTGPITVSNTAGTATSANPFTVVVSDSSGALISEFRSRGSGGSTDEYIELYNNTTSILDINTWTVQYRSGGSLVTVTVPAGATVPPYGHYLLANSGYVSNTPLTTLAPRDLALNSDIDDASGIVLRNAATTIVDAVAFTGSTEAGKGTPLPSAPTTNGEYAFVRRAGNSNPVSAIYQTGSNAVDFTFVSTTAGSFASITGGGTTTTLQSQLGVPTPEGIASPIQRDTFNISLMDTSAGANVAPNRVRLDPTDTGVVGSPIRFGRIRLRRALTNNSNVTVNRVRFKVVNITSLNSPGYSPTGTQADVRVIDSPTETVTTSTGTFTAYGTGLENAGLQTLMGGMNSTAVVLNQPLAPGATAYYNFDIGVAKNGSFLVAFAIESYNDTTGPTMTSSLVTTNNLAPGDDTGAVVLPTKPKK